MLVKRLPIWKLNPEPGIFAHVSWAAESIMERGPMLPDRSSNPCPHEGLSFAVSLNPDAWAEIAEIGTEAPVVVLEFNRPALDFYRWTGKREVQEIPELTEWGTRNGWITPGRDFLVWHWGGEEPEKRAFRFGEEDTKNLPYYREQLELWKEADEEVISIDEVPGWRYSKKLRTHIARHYKSPGETCMEAEVVNLWLQSEHPEIGMIWYAETLDVLGLSAPRGAILPAYFDEVRPLRIGTVWEWVEAD